MRLSPQTPVLPAVEDLRALLLDLDGTLADSNGAHARAWVQALADQQITREESEVRPLIGMGGDQLVPALTGESDKSDLGKALVQGWQDHFGPLIPDIAMIGGARDLLEWARDQGLTVVLASSGEDEIVDALLEQIGVSDLVPMRVRSDEVQQTKPEPDVLQAALAKAGVSAEQALFVGDTTYDARAARAAGVACVVLRAGPEHRKPRAERPRRAARRTQKSHELNASSLLWPPRRQVGRGSTTWGRGARILRG